MLKILRGEWSNSRRAVENFGRKYVLNGWCPIFIDSTTNWSGDWEGAVRRDGLLRWHHAGRRPHQILAKRDEPKHDRVQHPPLCPSDAEERDGGGYV